MYSARARSPARSCSRAQGLEECADTLIGNPALGLRCISGGEKRRASVAVELVTDPVCVFLDKPTSGLDSETAVKIMRTLRSLATAGRTVALTAHQPNSDITVLFDDFILMSQGKIMYAGARQHCLPQVQSSTRHTSAAACTSAACAAAPA
jgi:ABC-type multidrug transport system ATPase subunit